MTLLAGLATVVVVHVLRHPARDADLPLGLLVLLGPPRQPVRVVLAREGSTSIRVDPADDDVYVRVSSVNVAGNGGHAAVQPEVL